MKFNLNFNGFKVLPAEGGPPISLRLGGSASIPIAGVGGRFGDEATVPEAAEVFYKNIEKQDFKVCKCENECKTKSSF